MPIYAYKCTTCGFAQDEMQKIADAPLSVCPSCGKADYAKQVTAAGFALKGNGWYATDFKGNGSKPAETKSGETQSGETKSAETKSAETKSEAPSPACGTGASPAGN